MDNFKIMFLGGVSGKCKAGYDGSTYDSEGICPTLMTAQGGGRVPMVVETDYETIHSL